MTQIIEGLILTTLTLEFWDLQYWLPIIGSILLYQAFSILSKENKWFGVSFKILIISMLLQLIVIVVLTTPYASWIGESRGVGVLTTLLKIAFLVTFRQGMKECFIKTNVTIGRDPLLYLVIWHIGVLFFGCLELGSGLIISGIFFIAYFVIMYALYAVRSTLDSVIKHHRMGGKRVVDKYIGYIYLSLCFVGIMSGCIASNRLKIEATLVNDSIESEIRSHLRREGFPQEILTDLPDQVLHEFVGELSIQSSSELLVFETIGDALMEATTVYIQLPDNLLYVLIYFEWKQGKVLWQDGFTIPHIENRELVDGKLLYEKDGCNYMAPIPRLKEEYVQSTNFFGTSTTHTISGAISYPLGSNRQRGYILCRLKLPDDQIFGATLLNYRHMITPFQIPYSDPEQSIINGTMNRVQHYTNYDLKP